MRKVVLALLLATACGSRPSPIVQVPVISSISGNDPAVSSRIADGLLVGGLNLAQAAFQLRGSAGPIALAIRKQTDHMVELVLPADIRSGSFSLIATSASGLAEAPVQLSLPEVTSEIVLGRLQSAAGTPGLEGGNFILNADLEQTTAAGSALGFSSSGGSAPTRAPVSDGPAGAYALQNDSMSTLDVSSTTWISIDAASSYLATGTCRYTSGGASGRCILVVRLRDAQGTEIAGTSGRPHWFYVSEGAATGSAWSKSAVRFGADTAMPFPSNARYMTVGAMLNYDNANDATPGNRTVQVQGLGLYRLLGRETEQRIDRYHATCTALAATGTSSYVTVAAVTPGSSTVAMSGADVCDKYVGNNELTGWTCIGVPYVYANQHNQLPTGRYLGTDARPGWSACSTVHGPSDHYLWLDPWAGTGVMMACCIK